MQENEHRYALNFFILKLKCYICYKHFWVKIVLDLCYKTLKRFLPVTVPMNLNPSLFDFKT